MTSRRRLLALTIGLLLAATVPSASLAAGSTHTARSTTLCDPALDSEGSIDSHVSPVARDGSAREPDLGPPPEDMPASAKGVAKANFSATVPVYFHVITDGSTGALTDKQIGDQIAVLNMTFAGREGGARTGFSFTLAGVTRTDNAAWFGAGIGGTNERSMKSTLHQGGSNALNVYSTTAGAYLGWATFPQGVTKPGQADIDGIVLDWESLPHVSSTYAGRFDLGETLTHEAGHWLGLYHTFQGGCNAKGDYVDDTPAQKVPTSGCPEGKDTCKEPGLDPIHNYMDYSFDSCYTEFTAGQTQRMRDAWLFYRAP
jgi:Pregnancy-associated plasma protein-A